MNLPEKWHLPFVILIGLLIFLPHLGVLPVNIMEARNFVTAREMIQDNHWLLTTFNGEARYEKPPLPTWITAFSAAILGWDQIANLRIPAVLMALLLLTTAFFFARKLTGNSYYALLSAGIMATSFYILWAGRNGQWDIFTHAFMMVCIYQLYLFFTRHSSSYKHAVLAGLFLGFSFMSKGPVSMYALLLPFLISFGLIYGFRNHSTGTSQSRVIPLLLFFIISVILSSWWHAYIYLHDTLDAREITEKEVGNWNSYNVRPFYYYWNFFIQSGMWTIIAVVSLIYPYLKNRVFDKKAYQFVLAWTLISVLLLSFIPEKKPRYLLPVLIPLALNMGFYLEYLIRRFESPIKSWERWPAYAHFGLIAVIGLVLPLGGYIFLKDQVYGYSFWFILLSISSVIIGLFLIKSLRDKQIGNAFILSIGFMITVVVFGLPLSSAIAVNDGYKSLSQLRDWQDSAGLPVYEYYEATPELIWEFGKPIPVLYQANDYKQPSDHQFGLLAFESLESDVRQTFSKYKIEKVDYYDMSPRGKAQGGHKSRLYRDFYIITKITGPDHNL